VERDGHGLAFAAEPAEAENEIHVPRLAAQLSVRDALEADAFLQRHHVADGRILGGAQVGRARASGLYLQPERLE
jgi:hypothetical protein